MWVDATASPVAISGVRDAREGELLAHCGGAGVADAGLFAVARHVVAEKVAGRPALDEDALAASQRAAGEPHPWARAFIATSRNAAATTRRLDGWLTASTSSSTATSVARRAEGVRRCGVAHDTMRDGSEIVAIVVVEALADLAPLTLRAHAGQWLTVDARLLVEAAGARVVVVGPGGAPRGVPASYDARAHRVRARFAPDRPGAFTVQVLAEVDGGPRPVLEARVFADVEPSSAPAAAAPGEDVAPAATNEATLLRMIDAARAVQGAVPLARDRALDAVALAHARAMLDARTLGHDVGDGDPAQRVQNANIPTRVTGENVAHAESVALAHRAFWSSPSHRANVVRADFDRAGLAVLPDPHEGGVWVVELFTASP